MRIPFAAALVVAALLGGCADYLNNRDTVTFGAGDASAWNRAVQTQQPWNPDSKVTAIVTDGEQVLEARKLLLLPPAQQTAPDMTIGSPQPTN